MEVPRIPSIPKGPFIRFVCFPTFIGCLLFVALPGLRSSLPWLGRPAPALPEAKPSFLVSIKARNANVQEVLRTFAGQIGAKLSLDPSIRGRLSIQVRQSELTDVMNDLCQVYSCEWSHSNHVLTVSKSEAQAQP